MAPHQKALASLRKMRAQFIPLQEFYLRDWLKVLWQPFEATEESELHIQGRQNVEGRWEKLWSAFRLFSVSLQAWQSLFCCEISTAQDMAVLALPGAFLRHWEVWSLSNPSWQGVPCTPQHLKGMKITQECYRTFSPHKSTPQVIAQIAASELAEEGQHLLPQQGNQICPNWMIYSETLPTCQLLLAAFPEKLKNSHSWTNLSLFFCINKQKKYFQILNEMGNED